jgi:hypothetical protein
LKNSNHRFDILDLRAFFRSAGFAIFAIALFSMGAPKISAQTIATGSVDGVVTDPKGKAVAGAEVEITNTETSSTIHGSTSSAGMYSSGPIQPGNYSVRIRIKGFHTAHILAPVRVGNAVTANVKLQPGAEVVVSEVPVSGAVNVEQPTVQAVPDQGQMQQLPINARNVFDFAQLLPSVQTQDGGVLDPTKNGINSISLLSQFARQTRISLDGVDISDEIAGATTQNVPAGAIQEFQIEQSFLNLSTGPAISGPLNLITRSGSDHIHGDVFGVFRSDDEGAASLPGGRPQSFSRELFGGHAGGDFVKDKVFWFADAERAKQDLTEPEPFAFPFNGLNASLAEPYREFDTDERVDWNMRGSTRAFYRLNFFQNNDLRPFGSASSTQRLDTDTNTLTNSVGVDFNTGVYAHSFRVQYLKLHSSVTDATNTLGGADNPIPGLGVNIGASADGICALSDGGAYCGGPSWWGPQREFQSDKEARYDGSRIWRNHIIHYGIDFNRIDGARLTDLAIFPQVGTTWAGTLSSANPTAYPADYVTLGNGLGFATAQSAFGLRGGGLGPDNRLQLYAEDSFRVNNRFTFVYGVQYLHDSGLTDSNLGPLPVLNEWGSGYGDRIRNPNLNFSPQAGFAWNVGGTGKTVVRGGAALFFADPLLNNILSDTPARLAQGNYQSAPQVCSGGLASPFPWPTSLAGVASIAGGAAKVVPTSTGPQALPTFCGGTIASVAPAILALSSAYQEASASSVGSANSNFVGSTLSALNNRGYDLLYPGYRSPRSYQMNLGFEKAMGSNTTFSIDYIRNIGEHFLIGQDINHSGAARSFNEANALAARDAAQIAHGCPAGFGEASCMVAALGQAGAQAAYSAAGLDSNLQANGGAPCSYCAFPGTNPLTGNTGAVGGVDMLLPDGRSLYSGFQGRMVQHADKLMRGVRNANFEVVYTHSKFLSPVQDEGAVNLATDNDAPDRFTGPNALDRKHQISFGGTFDLPFYTKFSMVAHFYSPVAQNMDLPELTNGGEIFATDWLGTGLPANGVPEPLPGTQTGQYEGITAYDNIRAIITKYNHTYAGSLTPAGMCLTGNTAPGNPFACPGLVSGAPVMTPSDMAALGWVMPTIDSVAVNAPGIPWFKSMDLKFAWPLPVKGRFTIEPSASVFNVFNFWNAFLPGNLPNASLLPGVNGLLAPTAVGGVVPGSSLTPFRASLQSGTYAMGTPRVFEFGLRINF